MNDGPAPSSEAVTRREALRKAAKLGGTLAWTVPVVQHIAMSPAAAATTSPPPGGGGDDYCWWWERWLGWC